MSICIPQIAATKASTDVYPGYKPTKSGRPVSLPANRLPLSQRVVLTSWYKVGFAVAGRENKLGAIPYRQRWNRLRHGRTRREVRKWKSDMAYTGAQNCGEISIFIWYTCDSRQLSRQMCNRRAERKRFVIRREEDLIESNKYRSAVIRTRPPRSDCHANSRTND